MKTIKLLIIGIVISLASGCATYDSTTVEKTVKEVKILETGLEEGSYKYLEMVGAFLQKDDFSDKNPTKEQVNIVLIEKAKKLGADAVINVTYKSGVRMGSWGFMEAKGEAVRINGSK